MGFQTNQQVAIEDTNDLLKQLTENLNKLIALDSVLNPDRFKTKSFTATDYWVVTSNGAFPRDEELLRECTINSNNNEEMFK